MRAARKPRIPSSLSYPYAIGVTTRRSEIDTFSSDHPLLDKDEQSVTLCTLAHQFVHQVRISKVCLDVCCHVFRPPERSVLAFELSMYTDLDCYLLESAADELLARRYFLAISAMRRTQGKLQGSLHFAKPSKQLVALFPQSDPDMATARLTIERCHADLQTQHEALWQALEAKLRVTPIINAQACLAKQVA
jgi:hypothetical protein